MSKEKKFSEWDIMVANQAGNLADLAVSKALESSRESFEAFKQDIEAQVNAMAEKEVILKVQLNDAPPVKIKQRAGKALPRLLANAQLGLYTLLVGPAGCGKTTMAYQVAQSLALPFGSVCLTAGASETWLFGRQTPTGFVEGPFAKAYREGGVFLADEMDAADANLLLSINTALSHNEMLNPMNGEVIKKHDKFIFIGAANTNGKGSTHTYTGRSRLDAATLDRMIIIEVGYDSALEQELCPDQKMHSWLAKTRAALTKQGFDEFISTRAFLFSYRQLLAGVDRDDIRDSIIANWGDAARDAAKHEYNMVFAKRSKAESDKERGKFYEKFLAVDKSTKWRPIQWKDTEI